MLGFREIISHNSKVYCTNHRVFHHQCGWHTRAPTLVQKVTRGSHLCSESTNLVRSQSEGESTQTLWRLSRRAEGSSESGPCALRKMRAFPRFYAHPIGSSNNNMGTARTTTKKCHVHSPRSVDNKEREARASARNKRGAGTACKCGTTSLLSVIKKIRLHPWNA